MKKPNKTFEKVKPFEVKCKDIFIWAGYKPHTKFHAARYPLIGDWNSWQRLEDCLTILFKGQTPFDTTSEHAEHVLDVIISSDQNWDKFRLMKTSMNTIAFIDAEVNKMENLVYSKWISKLKLINGSLAIIHFDKANATDAADEERGTTDDEYQTSINQMIIIPQKNEARSSSASPSPTKLVSLIHDNSVKQRKEMDMLSVAFGGGGLAEIISIYQERCIQKVMDDCGAIKYNTDLNRNDPPDGYYLCDQKILGNLKEHFHGECYIFETSDVFDPPKQDEYILLAVEAKATMDSLQIKLDDENYYVLRRSPPPIRNLIVVSGGLISRTWIFLINLAHTDSSNDKPPIGIDIVKVRRKFVDRLRESHAHVVFISSFTSESFRQEPLTYIRLQFLDDLIFIAKQLMLDLDEKQKNGLVKKSSKIMQQFMMLHSTSQFRSQINDRILLCPEIRTDRRLLCFLEQLCISFVRETYRTTHRLNVESGIQIPKSLIKFALELRPKPNKLKPVLHAGKSEDAETKADRIVSSNSPDRQALSDKTTGQHQGQSNLIEVPISSTVEPILPEDNGNNGLASNSTVPPLKTEEKKSYGNATES